MTVNNRAIDVEDARARGFVVGDGHMLVTVGVKDAGGADESINAARSIGDIGEEIAGAALPFEPWFIDPHMNAVDRAVVPFHERPSGGEISGFDPAFDRQAGALADIEA